MSRGLARVRLHVGARAAQAGVVEVAALLGQPGRGLLAVEEDEADLARAGRDVRPGERARHPDDDRRAGRAVVGADEALRLDERVVVRADDDRRASCRAACRRCSEAPAHPEPARTGPPAASAATAPPACAAGATRRAADPTATCSLTSRHAAVRVEPIRPSAHRPPARASSDDPHAAEAERADAEHDDDPRKPPKHGGKCGRWPADADGQATDRPSGGDELERRLDRRQPDIRPAPPADEHLVPLAGLLEVVAEVVAELLAPTWSVSGERCGSGAEGTRTPGPQSAILMLYQLSYSPRQAQNLPQD